MLAVIIKGNPKFINTQVAKDYYKEIEKFLKNLGFKVEFDPGADYTRPRQDADLYIGHSRGAGRYEFMTEKAKKKFLRFGDIDGIIHPVDKEWQLANPPPTNSTPPDEHFEFDDEQQEAIRDMISGYSVESKAHDIMIFGEAHFEPESVKSIDEAIRRLKPTVIVHELLDDRIFTVDEAKKALANAGKPNSPCDPQTNIDVFQLGVDLNAKLFGCDLSQRQKAELKSQPLSKQFAEREKRMLEVIFGIEDKSNMVVVVGDIHLRKTYPRNMGPSAITEAIQNGLLKAVVIRAADMFREVDKGDYSIEANIPSELQGLFDQALKDRFLGPEALKNNLANIVPLTYEGKTVGFSIPFKEMDDYWRTGSIYVDPKYRGKDVAGKFIREFSKDKLVRAWIEPANYPSQKAFKGAGFRNTGRKTHVGNKVFEEWISRTATLVRAAKVLTW